MPLCTRYLANPRTSGGKIESKRAAWVTICQWTNFKTKRTSKEQKYKNPCLYKKLVLIWLFFKSLSNWQSANYFSLHYTFWQESKVNLAKPVENMLRFTPNSKERNVFCLKKTKPIFGPLWVFYVATIFMTKKSTFCNAICSKNNSNENKKCKKNDFGVKHDLYAIFTWKISFF